MKIKEEVIEVLVNCRVEGTKLFLPDIQLERSLYVGVNKVLDSLGGKWNRSAKAHLFNESPEQMIDNVLLTGEYTDAKKEFQFFETNEDLALDLVSRACIKDGETVLEPSAGKGGIAQHIENVDCVELMPENRQYLIDKGYNLVGENFLDHTEKYDVIVANPPFSKQQDIIHVNHMLDIARRKVVAVMSLGVVFRTDKRTIAFRERVKSMGGTIERLPDKSFVSSGTSVSTCVVEVGV